MKTLFARADLVRILDSLGGEALHAIAAELGYEPEPEIELEPPPLDADRGDEELPIAPARPSAQSIAVQEPLWPITFWRPTSIDYHGLEDIKARAQAAAVAEIEADASQPWLRGENDAPASPPLSPWRRLGPLLKRALSEEQRGRGIDLPKLIQTIVRGRHVARLPRLRRRRWAPVEIIVDRAYRLAPFWHDQRMVIGELIQVLGRQRVRLRILANGPKEHTGEFADLIKDRARNGVPVLVLSDLGMYGGEEERADWLRLAMALRSGGESIVALVPVPRSRWSQAQALTRAWRAIPWEREVADAAGEGGYGTEDVLEGRRGDKSRDEKKNTDRQQARVEQLLLYLSPALRIDRGLIRTIRRILPLREANVGVEADVWAHSCLGDMYPGFRVMEPEYAMPLRSRFMHSLPVEDQMQVIEALRAWHWNRNRPPEAWHLEVLQFSRLEGSGQDGDNHDSHESIVISEVGSSNRALIARDELEKAEKFISWVAGPALRGELDPGEAETLRRWCHFIVDQAPRSLWDASTVVGEALQTIAFRAGGIDVPDADPRVKAMLEREQGKARVRPIYQVGHGFAVTRDAVTRGGSLFASVIAADPQMWLVSGKIKEGTLGLNRPGGQLSAPPRGSAELRTDRTTLCIEAIEKPAWAQAIGRDSYGLWAMLVVKEVSYRMRWIPPGRFVMGSPEGEPGRDDDETQHEVIITQGYWLGETPVTQALWQEVMGEGKNPSHFKDPQRPVERVSWEDCQGEGQGDLEGGLMKRLNEAFDPEHGECFRLPTEAEWEYACRAGTTTATYAGSMEILGENNAPVLDEIAWYGGNCGVEYDLDVSYDASSWPDQQHLCAKAGSRRVGQKFANAWGLHDMLGNVWEWCMDWHGGYAPYANDASEGQENASEAQLDPSGPRTGGCRVIRGGSWRLTAWFVRAAYRGIVDPGRRNDYLGLRLARGQGVRQDPRGPGGPKPGGRK